jgi:dolichol-phosphate mannosyltransferase
MSGKRHDTLIFIPTYNERGNVEAMCEQILALALQADIVFLDDNSPDGTGEVLDRLAAQHENISVIHRSGKLGIGGAHLDGIAWAYERGYETLVTMDCDFTHSPSDIPRLLERLPGHDVVVGSRFLQEKSLPGWNLLRRTLTWLGHFLTRGLLGMGYDATGAFRVYRLSRIPAELFRLVSARGYSFFFESLFVLHFNRFVIAEVPIVLPARTYGHSKMSFREAARSGTQVVSLALSSRLNPARWRVAPPVEVDPRLVDPQGWDGYWDRQKTGAGLLYDLIAFCYRTTVIKRCLNRAIRRQFPEGAVLLHAGCGSGQVDVDLQKSMKITALDISVPALELYRGNNPQAQAVKHGSIFDLPFHDATFDGVYNLGVMEHFTEPEIARILAQFHRVLKPNGKVVFFWPHAHGSSVMFLGAVHWLLHRLHHKEVRLHPPEITLLASRRQAESYLVSAGFNRLEYRFGPRDFFVQAVVVGQKVDRPTERLDGD